MLGQVDLPTRRNRVRGFVGREHGGDTSVDDSNCVVFQGAARFDRCHPASPHEKLGFHPTIIMITVNPTGPAVSVAARDKDYSPGIRWNGRRLELLDQRLLPGKTAYVCCDTACDVAAAIRAMVVRGAPAIGIAAAYGVALSARRAAELPFELRASAMAADFETLGAARPTAVNLAWALDHMRPLAEGGAGFGELAAAAEAIHAQDIAVNRRLAESGSKRIGPDSRILTHCNTGPLATGGIGTAFGVIAAAWRAGSVRSIHFSETRPWLQGARLTAWEFARADIPATLMTDLAAASLALAGGVDWLVVGADRIAANGDSVNKIGTAVLAAATRRGGGRVMVVAPYATVDAALGSGAAIPIEEREGDEIWRAACAGSPPPGIEVANPVFDVTVAADIDFIVTERGVVAPGEGQTPVARQDRRMVE